MRSWVLPAGLATLVVGAVALTRRRVPGVQPAATVPRPGDIVAVPIGALMASGSEVTGAIRREYAGPTPNAAMLVATVDPPGSAGGVRVVRGTLFGYTDPEVRNLNRLLRLGGRLADVVFFSNPIPFPASSIVDIYREGTRIT